MIFAIPILLIMLLVSPVRAWEKPGPADYTALTKAADIVIQGTVQNVELAKDWQQLTKVNLVVDDVKKGSLSKGAELAIFYEPNKIIDSPIQEFRCPPFPVFTIGKTYSIWALWNPENHCYIVPTKKWTLEK